MEEEHLIPQENESLNIENTSDVTSEEVVNDIVNDESVNEVIESTSQEETVVEEVTGEIETTEELASVESSEEGDVEVQENAESGEEEFTEPQLSVADVISGGEEGGTEEGADVDVAPAPIVKKKSNKKWYSLRVISGKEKKIKERIELEIQRNKWESSITQVLVPTEKVYKIRAGKKVILERNILPGYILVEAIPGKFRGAMVTAIANIPNVIHFLGRNHPIPMHQSEANRMLGKVDESQDMSAAMIEPYIIGETVKIIDGPFKDFVGDIKEVNEERKKMKVIVKIFGRGTEVELNFMQVEKQS